MIKDSGRILSNSKLKQGRARKVLWQYRNKDIEDFEFIDAVHYLEDMTLRIVSSQINFLHGKRAGSKEYKRGYGRALSDLSDLIDKEFNNSENKIMNRSEKSNS